MLERGQGRMSLMNMSIVGRALALTVLAHALPVWAQHDTHAPGSQPAANPEQVTACVQSQRQVMALVEAGNHRLELARQTNDAPAMRSAMDDFQTMLTSIKAQLASCAAIAAAVTPPDPHAGHATTAPSGAPGGTAGSPVMRPGATPPAPGAARAAPPPQETAPTAPAAVDPHAGHTMPAQSGSPAPAARRPARRPAAAPQAKPAAPASADPHAGHAMPTPSPSTTAPAAAQSDLVEDPVSKAKVDPRTSLRVLYQGKMYYFRSDAERQEFMRNPEKYVSGK